MAGLQLLNRRNFIKTGLLAGAGVAVSAAVPFSLSPEKSEKQLMILHTNDVHSRIDPFPVDGSRNQGLGGFSRRAALIKKFRKENPGLLLFDSGDILQGTPYFNTFHGEVEFRLMSEMKYNAAVLGNHEFDLKVNMLANQIEKYARFPFVVSNYEVGNTPLENFVVKNKIYEINGLRIGVYGLGIELQGLAPMKNIGNVKYEEPVKVMTRQEEILKFEYKCDAVICLSHLGYSYKSNKISDKQIAALSSYTDVILGGHTHTFLQKPDIVKNSKNGDCYVFQTGWGGINIGVIQINFNIKSANKSIHGGLLNVY